MESPENATSRSLVYQPNWELESMYSCCSADVVVRLEANYCTRTQRNARVHCLIDDEYGTNVMRCYGNLADLVRDYTLDAAFAVSLDIAFAGVLSNCLEGGASMLYLATDNMTRPSTGDVHPGPFSTRGFCRWLARNKLATIVRGPTTTGDTTVTGWIWTLKFNKSHAYVAAKKEEFKEEYNKIAKRLPDDDGEWVSWQISGR